MIYASVTDEVRPLPFYLAMEEHLARNYPDKDFFFMWQVEPTVIFGRCQNPYAEVNLDFCRREGIHTYRRKSGGGCVYADMNNIMFSHVITTRGDVPTVFGSYCNQVVATLRKLGLDASASGRNDVLISGRKVSGYAFYHLHGRSIVHGTMLYDVDAERMARAITPSHTKLQAKGVKSVRSHVTTIREHLPRLTLKEFRDFCRREMCDSEQEMTPADIASIEEICRGYLTPQWIWGRYASEATAPLPRRRVEGAGEFAVDIDLEPPAAPGDPATIRRVNMQGDFFLLSDLDEELLDHLRGVPYTRVAVAQALEATDPQRVISGLSRRTLTDLLFDE